MKIFIIPSWYPSEACPSTGIFHKEQAQLLARYREDWKVGISLWGSHEPQLWVRILHPLEALIKLTGRFLIKPYQRLLSANCVEFFTPAHTWTRHIWGGNIQKIIGANENNLKDFIEYFGVPDLIQAEIAFPAGRIAMELSNKYKIPFIIREQMSPFPLPSFQRDFKKMLIPQLKAANAVIAVGSNLKSELASFSVNAESGINFIDIEYFVPVATESQKENLKIFALGRLENQKGFDMLLDALKDCTESNWRLRLGGSGAQSNKLRRRTKANDLEGRVNFLGTLEREAVKEEMQFCDFFVLSSRHESFGVVLIEAMACGKPVLVTRCGGITTSLPDEVAIKCEPTVAGLKDGLKKMSVEYHQFSPVIIRKYVLQHFNVSVVTKQLIQLQERFK